MNIKKALVVDDSKVAHLTLRKLLTERKIEVDWVDSGELAINYMREHRPDIIFMDVMMPGLDGFETTKAITSDPTISAPPIIMCSANATDEDKQTAAQCGASDFLSKPYTPAQMDQVLQRVSEMISAAPAAIPAPIPAPTFDAISLVESIAEVPPAPPASPPAGREELEILGLEESPRAPAPAVPPAPALPPTPPSPVPPSAAVSSAEIERLVRALVDPQVKAAIAEAVQKAEQTARSLSEEAGRKAAQVAVQVSQNAAKKIEEMITANQESLQKQLSKLVHTEVEQVARRVSEEVLQSHQPRTPTINPEVILREAEQQTYNTIQQSLEDFLKSRELNQRLNEFAKKTIMPEIAAATQDMVETRMQTVKSGGGLVPMAIGVIALVIALAAVALKFIPL